MGYEMKKFLDAIKFMFIFTFVFSIFPIMASLLDPSTSTKFKDVIIVLGVNFFCSIWPALFSLFDDNSENKKNFSSMNNKNNNMKYRNKDSKKISKTTPKDRAKDLISKKFDEITKNMNPNIVKSRKRDLFIYASSLLSEDKNSLEKIYQGTSIQDYDKLIDDFHIREEKRLKNHISYEGRIGVRDKRILKEKLGYTCQACGLKMSEKYGNIGANYIELHHKVPYSQLQENDNRLLNVNDFCVLCPNCHRMIHKLENAGDIKLLKEILKSKSE